MNIRRRVLPPGWYPGEEEETRETIARYLRGIGEHAERENPKSIAGVVPHAGWEFSGRTALEVLTHISKSIDTIVVTGGHLSSSAGLLAAWEDGYETPLGILPADLELLRKIESSGEISIREDRSADNTVEIQLPFIKYLFPESRALYLRAAPAADSIDLGRAIKEAAEKLGRRVAVIGSTDLTHYGSNYGFSPVGRGEDAVKWVKKVNDRGFIDNLLQMDAEGALRDARENQSACSAGGAVAALSFAREMGVNEGELISYLTSYDIYPNESFVGYAGIIYSLL
ncbi:MAG: AmmeMemoRadiSam system protein B [Candidatus Auribacterota bacterium]|nr:AmmeMemoRadiSam system protein B [Candidatus Auribacterota bacterium]